MKRGVVVGKTFIGDNAGADQKAFGECWRLSKKGRGFGEKVFSQSTIFF